MKQLIFRTRKGVKLYWDNGKFTSKNMKAVFAALNEDAASSDPIGATMATNLLQELKKQFPNQKELLEAGVAPN